MVTELKSFFMTQGYKDMGTNNRQFEVLYLENGLNVQVLVLNGMISGMEATKEQYLNLLRQVEQAFYQSGYQRVDILSLICTKDAYRVREFCIESVYNSWIIDLQNNRLMIYENQQAQYREIQRQLEDLLARRGQNVYDGMRERRTGGSIREIVNTYPIATIVLIVINVIVFIGLELTGSSESAYHLYEWGANEYEAIFVQHEYYRLFTSMFLHAGPEHLLNNMFVLAIIGGRLEKILGKFRYTTLYVVTGLIASYGSEVYDHWIGESGVGVGASGAIFGVIGGIFYIILRYHGKKTGITISQMLIFIGLSLYSGIANSSNVNNAAHIIGFISGVAIAGIIDLVGSKKRIR